ncbi:MAG: N-acetyltransferase, partial [Shewanella sp.]
KGLAERLVRQGLKWAKEQEMQITASCWYVQKFLKN